MTYSKTLFTIFILALLTFTPGAAETRVHPIGIEVTFPDAWDAEFSEDELFLNESDESAVVLVRVVEDVDDLEDAAEDVIDELSEWVSNSEVTSQDNEGTLNGMKALFIEGTGRMNDTPAMWMVVFVEFKNKVVMIAGWGERGEWDPEKGDVVDIIRSVQPE